MSWAVPLAGWLSLATLAPTVAQDRDPSLTELAAAADLIAVARVEQVDYQKTREFPSSGSAFLKILIPYKGAAKGDWIEVVERGLAADACYYPEPGVWDFEGARFLVLLNKSGPNKDTYRGRAPGCRLPVLVTADNRYALRVPVAGLRLGETDAATELEFADPAAFVDASDFTRAELDELVSVYRARRVEPDDPLAPPRDLYVYTRGIPIERVRELMFPPRQAAGGAETQPSPDAGG